MSEKNRRLKWDREHDAGNSWCDVPAHVNSRDPKIITKQWQNNFRKNEDWKPGRTSQQYRNNYDSIFGKKNDF